MHHIQYLVDFIIHLNTHMNMLVNVFGIWTYAILFLIIFCETGLIIIPFLPGDSLLFTIGMITSTTGLNVHIMILTLSLAAVLGDNCNYFIGHKFGKKSFNPKAKILKSTYLTKTHFFFEKYGAKAIILARFIPLIRTFTPFAAGMGRMAYKKFLALSILAAIIWVSSLIYLGYFFGNINFIKDKFSIFLISAIALLAIYLVNDFRKKRNQAKKCK